MSSEFTRSLHHSPLAHDTITVLERDLPPGRVLSLVLDVNPASALNEAGNLPVRARRLLDTLGIPDALTQPVMNDLAAAQRSTPTRVYFLWDEHGHARSRLVDVRLNLTESARFGAPDLEPLRFALESSPRILIALVGSEWARLFSLHLDGISEVYRLEMENVPGPDDTDRVREPRGAVQARPQDPVPLRSRRARQEGPQQEGRLQQALRVRVQHLREVGAFEHLLVAGPVRSRASFTAALGPDLKRALAGEFPAAGDATAAEVFRAAQEALGTLEREAETALLDEAQERGLLGVAATLQAVQEGRVSQMLIPGDGSGVPVWQDSAGHVFAALPDQGVSPLTGEAVRGQRLYDVLPSLRERFGVHVRSLSGVQAERLETRMGGLAGLPRS